MKFVKNVIVVNCKVYGSFLWTIFIMLLCFSCTNSSDKGLKFKNPQSISGHSQLVMNEKANPTIINLNFKDSLDTGFDWDYIIDNIHAIPLETNSEFLIGEISSVLFTDTTIFIRDKKTDYLTCFNRKGKALFKISNKGSGPNEYRSITDVYIDDWTKTINIYDNIGGKIVSYSLSDGSFIGNKKYVGKFLDIMPIKDGFVHMSKNLTLNDDSCNYSLIECDTSGYVVNKINAFPLLWSNLVFFDITESKLDEGYLIPDVTNNSVYYLNETTNIFEIKYKFKNNDNELNKSLYNLVNSKYSSLNKSISIEELKIFKKDIQNNKILIGPVRSIATSTQVLFFFQYNNEYIPLAWMPEKGAYVFGFPNDKNDFIKRLLSIRPFFPVVDNDRFVTVIYPSELLLMIENMVKSKGEVFAKEYLFKHPDVVKFATLCKENSNPILIFLTPKHNM